MIRVSLVAHGLGGRLDLPVPLTFFAAGAAVVLIATFLWRRCGHRPASKAVPRTADCSQGVARAPQRHRRRGPVAGDGGGSQPAVAGGDEPGARNIAPVLLWVYFWLVVPFLGAVLGDLYTGLNPWRTLSRLLGIGEVERQVDFFLGALPIWYIQVGAIVLGHVAGVVLAHDPCPWPISRERERSAPSTRCCF